jgi:hypothetical protein
MRLAFKILGLGVLWSAAVGSAAAQEPPAAPTPAASAPATTVTKPAKTTAQAEAGEPRANTTQASPERPPPRAAQKAQNAVDRLDLSTATVTGDHEQPKVMYIVPWKKPDMGDVGGKPMNTLLDEVLAPVDRDVFKRQVNYYGAVKADASQNGAPGVKPATQGEK